MPLLDEAAELLGDDDGAGRGRAAGGATRGARARVAREVLEDSGGGRDGRPLSAELLARPVAGGGASATVAERAAADRTWTYGHVVVDEAQELSPMAWRLLMRRCPTRSMTIVGDVAQTGARPGRASWAQVLRPYVAERCRDRDADA